MTNLVEASLDTALAVLSAGHLPIPVHSNAKRPIGTEWQNSRYTPKTLRAGYDKKPGLNIGILLGKESGVIDVEIDGPECLKVYEALFPEGLPETVSYTSDRGTHRLYRWADCLGELPSVVHVGADGKIAPKDIPSVEFRLGSIAGAQSLLPPSIVRGGNRREWIHDFSFPMADLPESVLKMLTSLPKETKVNYTTEGYDELSKLEAELRDIKIADLERYFERAEIPYKPELKNGVFAFCFPFCLLRGPKHPRGGSIVFVNADGSHSFNCKHAKCAGATWQDVEHKYGPLHMIIRVRPDTPRVVGMALEALRRAPVFQRGVLVEMTHEPVKPELCLHENGTAKLRAIPKPTLSKILSECARWEKWSAQGKKWVHCVPPELIVNAVDSQTDFGRIPPVTGVVPVPVLRQDGTILSEPGYDRRTGLMLVTSDTYPPLMDVEKATRSLDDVFCDFPFELPAHKSMCYAALLTLFCRHAFRGSSPFFMFEANTSRAGKGMLTDAIMSIYQGSKAARYAVPGTDDELRKLITAIALSGNSYLLFDNIKDKFGGPTLENAITAAVWSDRLLSFNKNVELPLTFLWFGTGNNPSITKDMFGRMGFIRLNSPLEHPELRDDFRHLDLIGHIKANRPQLAMAALSIPAAYIKAGRPNLRLSAWGGFQEWSDLVRSALVWAGLDDPGETRSHISAPVDEDTSLLKMFIAGWEELPGPMRIRQVFELLSAASDDQYPLLRAAIDELGGNDKKKALGNLLRDSRLRVVDGKCFERTKESHPKWELR